MLATILQYQVVAAAVMSGDTYVIQDATGENANIVAADVKASNGVAHVIDRVLLPN